MMFERKLNREIQEIIEFPKDPEDPYDKNKWYSLIAVSYTHLDVYKRQELAVVQDV